MKVKSFWQSQIFLKIMAIISNSNFSTLFTNKDYRSLISLKKAHLLSVGDFLKTSLVAGQFQRVWITFSTSILQIKHDASFSTIFLPKFFLVGKEFVFCVAFQIKFSTLPGHLNSRYNFKSLSHHSPKRLNPYCPVGYGM